MKTVRSSAFALCLLWGFVAHGEGEELRVTLPAPGTEAWTPLSLPRVERETDYRAEDLEGTSAVHARSECSASALVLPLSHIDLGKTPRLYWRWRVDEDVPNEASPKEKSGDDFAARVYVMFPFDAERASMWERMQRSVVSALYDHTVPGEALNYVWTGRLAEGETWPNPFTADSHMISLGAGEPGSWQEEEVDVARDYAAAFGRAAPKPQALGIMSDSDGSCARATAWFAGFEFRGP